MTICGTLTALLCHKPRHPYLLSPKANTLSFPVTIMTSSPLFEKIQNNLMFGTNWGFKLCKNGQNSNRRHFEIIIIIIWQGKSKICVEERDRVI